MQNKNEGCGEEKNYNEKRKGGGEKYEVAR
jgi:hypothetical protein